MPIYEYFCDACENTIEMLYFNKTPLTCPCDKCGNIARRIMSTPNVKINNDGREITTNDFDDLHKWKMRTTEERNEALKNVGVK